MLDLSMGFMTDLCWKGTSYDSIPVIIGLHNQLVQIDVPKLMEIISDIVIWYHNLPSLATETQSSHLSSDFLILLLSWIAVITCAFFMRTSNKNLMTKCLDMLNIVNLFPLDFWSYLNGFSY